MSGSEDLTESELTREKEFAWVMGAFLLLWGGAAVAGGYPLARWIAGWTGPATQYSILGVWLGMAGAPLIFGAFFLFIRGDPVR